MSGNTNIQFILGGVRSGKSKLAEQRASASKLPVIYLATAQALDQEMTARIEHHQQSRPQHWQLIETPLLLPEAIAKFEQENVCLLVDCLTLWLTNCLCQHGVDYFLAEKAKLLAVLERCQCQVVLVSNEVGHGIVPLGELSRDFVDHSGWLHQEIAAIAGQVEFVMAGLPLSLKNTAVGDHS